MTKTVVVFNAHGVLFGFYPTFTAAEEFINSQLKKKPTQKFYIYKAHSEHVAAPVDIEKTVF